MARTRHPGPDETPAAPSEAEPEAASEEEEAPLLRWGRPSVGGLSGFGEVIGTDPLPDMAFRTGFSINTQELLVWEKFGPGSGSARIQLRAQVYRLEVAAAFMKMIEVSLAVPIIDLEQSSNFGFRDQDVGAGNPELSVKFRAPIDSDMFSIALYNRLHFSWGERDILKPKKLITEGDRAEWELGAAIGLHFGPASIITNVAFRYLEGGLQTLRYRFGVAIDPIDMLSVTVYWDGEEFEGKTRNFGSFGGTIHAFVAEMVVIGVGAETLIVDDALEDIVTTGSGDKAEAWRVTFDLSILF